jgi:pyridoxal phosphate enzyme (YggS family)
MGQYEKPWQDVKVRIERAARSVGRDPAAIWLVAVSKTFSPDAIRAVHAIGQHAFAENYVQEALVKMDALADLPDLEWHLVGPLQSNKARLAAEHFDWVHSVDRLKIAQRLAAARPRHLPPLDVCIQVNISAEETKSGIAPSEVLPLARAIGGMTTLQLRGLMGIAEETSDAPRQRAQFRMLRERFDACRAAGLPLDTLSMGMSADLEAAIAEGATLVRIGSAIFGSRTATPVDSRELTSEP